MKKILMLTAATLMLGAAPVLAETKGDHEDHKSKMFEKHDTNGDGMISESEFVDGAKKRFTEEDTNKDGSISKEEAKAAHEARRERMKEKRNEWKEKQGEQTEKSETAPE